MNNIELYIKDSLGNLVILDLFDDEKVSVEDSIQNVKDINKIFTPFTRDFKVPASFENNKLFKHYYNLNISNGFDGRIKTEALIKVGGFDYRKGFLRLISVGLKGSQPSYYKVTFQGDISTLKDLLEDKELKDLNYSDFDFQDTPEARVEGIRDGIYIDPSGSTAGLYPDLIYAPIFTKGKVVAYPSQRSFASGSSTYDESLDDNNYDFDLVRFTGQGVHNNLVETDSGDNFYHDVISPYDFKPSIKVGRLLKMISQQYNLGLDSSFTEREEIDQMYLCYNGEPEEPDLDSASSAFNNNTSSSSAIPDDEIFRSRYTTELVPSGDSVAFNNNSNLTRHVNRIISNRGYGEFTRLQMYSFNFLDVQYEGSVRATASMFYIDDSGEKVVVVSRTQELTTGNTAIVLRGSDADLNTFSQDFYYTNMIGKTMEMDVYFEATKALNGNLTSNVKIQTFRWNEDDYVYEDGFNTQNTTTTITDASLFNIKKFCPDMKLIDFILGLFKTLNLTSYIEDDKIVIKTLKEYYSNPKTYDITAYIKTDTATVAKGFNYKNVIMENEDHKDIMSKNYNGADGNIGFGEIKINKNTFIEGGEELESEQLDFGKDYKIKTPFARMMYENLNLAFDSTQTSTGGKYSSDAGGLPTDMVIGNQIDDKLEGVEVQPLLFYAKQVDISLLYTDGSAVPEDVDDIGGMIKTLNGTSYVERGNSAGRHGREAFGRSLVLSQFSEIANSTEAEDEDHIIGHRPFVSTDGLTDIGKTDKTRWWNPSNIMASRYRRDGSLINSNGKFSSLLFNNDSWDEFEYHNELRPQAWINGLYHSHYEEYLRNVYNKQSRLSTFDIIFPQALISKYKLNDTFIVGTNEYNINKITIDLLTGEGKVELINKLEFEEVEISKTDGEIVQESITGLNLLPASGNYLYNTTLVTKSFYDETTGDLIEVQTVNSNSGDVTKSDAEVALDRMQSEFPNLESLSVIVTWYGDTDNPDMVIKPRLDIDTGDPTYNIAWSVGSYDRTNTPEVTITAAGKANQGGTPGDAGVIEFIAECNTRGIKVMCYPFLQMDTPNKGWRGMIPFTTKAEIDTWWLQYEPFIRHYSQLFAASSLTLDKFMIGTELVTLTRYNENDEYFGVQHLVQLAEDVRTDFGSSDPVQISYGANWDEYHSHDENYHMDELWTSPYIDAVGIDNYFPATDFQDPSTITYQDVYDGYEKGEGWDHYYSVYSSDPATMLASKVDYPIAGGEFAWKNIFGWWDRSHTAHTYTIPGNPTLGSELLTSADFSSIAYPWNYGSWSYIPSPTVNAGIATLPISGGDYPTVNPRIEQDFVTISGEIYTVEVDVNDAQSIAIQVLAVDPNNGYAYLNGDTQTFVTSGTITFDFTATSVGTTLQILVQGVDGDSVELNSASVKQQTAGSATTITNTAWTARMKPLFFAEYGFASVDGTANQPNVFAPELPRLSADKKDFNSQRIGLRAFNDYWDDKTAGVSGFAEDRYAWAYDLRPYPQFPHAGIWDDSDAWEKGHWLNGKL